MLLMNPLCFLESIMRGYFFVPRILFPPNFLTKIPTSVFLGNLLRILFSQCLVGVGSENKDITNLNHSPFYSLSYNYFVYKLCIAHNEKYHQQKLVVFFIVRDKRLELLTFSV